MGIYTEWFDGRSIDEADQIQARRAPLRYWGLRAALVAALVLLFSGPGFSDPVLPPARDGMDCQLVSDLVWAARAMQKHGVDAVVAAKVLHDFYRSTQIEDRLGEYVPAAIRLAARHRTLEPHELASLDMMACARSRGDLTSIFGVES